MLLLLQAHDCYSPAAGGEVFAGDLTVKVCMSSQPLDVAKAAMTVPNNSITKNTAPWPKRHWRTILSSLDGELSIPNL